MSMLTDTQKRSAMYYGGTTQKKAKAAMRRTATHLAAVQDSLQLGTLGPLKPDELAALASAAQIMRRLADLTEHAAEEADRIKSRIEHRRAEAMSALNAAPVASTADQVGRTLRFQAWPREPLGGPFGSGFTDAVKVTFQ